MAENISFQSNGLKIAGLIDTPPDYKAGERRPAFIVLHGFGGNKDGHGQSVVAQQFIQWGYVTLRIDFRGCGERYARLKNILSSEACFFYEPDNAESLAQAIKGATQSAQTDTRTEAA